MDLTKKKQEKDPDMVNDWDSLKAEFDTDHIEFETEDENYEGDS